MGTYQTTYSEAPAIGLPGQIASEEVQNIVSREVETAAGIAFGQPVQRGSADHGVAILSSGDFLGIAVQNPAVPPDDSNPDAYPRYFTGAFMTMGTMYVTAGDDVTDGAAVYWDSSAKKYIEQATGAVQIPGAFFETSGGEDDIVIISLNLRN